MMLTVGQILLAVCLAPIVMLGPTLGCIFLDKVMGKLSQRLNKIIAVASASLFMYAGLWLSPSHKSVSLLYTALYGILWIIALALFAGSLSWGFFFQPFEQENKKSSQP